RVARIRVKRVFPQDMNAFGPRPRIVGEHAAQLDRVARIAGILLSQGAHGRDGLLLAAGGAIEGLVVGPRDVALGWMIAVELTIDAHRLVAAALPRQVSGPAQIVALRMRRR